nr:hypothetical protein [Mycobacterium canetti]
MRIVEAGVGDGAGGPTGTADPTRTADTADRAAAGAAGGAGGGPVGGGVLPSSCGSRRNPRGRELLR